MSPLEAAALKLGIALDDARFKAMQRVYDAACACGFFHYCDADGPAARAVAALLPESVLVVMSHSLPPDPTGASSHPQGDGHTPVPEQREASPDRPRSSPAAASAAAPPIIDYARSPHETRHDARTGALTHRGASDLIPGLLGAPRPSELALEASAKGLTLDTDPQQPGFALLKDRHGEVVGAVPMRQAAGWIAAYRPAKAPA